MFRSTIIISALSLCGVSAFTACGSSENENSFGKGDDGGSLFNQGDAGIPGCQGFECDIVKNCPGGAKTTITGKVYDPAGKIPLYNVVVYVPKSKGTLPAITHGASCDRCGTSVVSPAASALTNEKGEFVLENVPAGDNITLVLQIGKWRRILHQKVEACKTVSFNKDNGGREDVMRLPRGQNDGEGDMPQFAISTGSADPLPCLLPRIGIDAAEFTAPTGSGRVHVFRGNGGNIAGVTGNSSETTLWNATASLSKYDIVMLSCESGEHNETKSDAQRGFLKDYLNAGGRVFATHYHYTWFKNGKNELADVATWGTTGGANGSGTFDVDTSFPKGLALGNWLRENGASTDGKSINLVDIATSIATPKGDSQSWINDRTGNYKPKYLSFNTPVGLKPEAQCGKGVLSDIHVSKGTKDDAIPTSCGTSDLIAQEKALLFMLMDLSSCVQNDKEQPVAPK